MSRPYVNWNLEKDGAITPFQHHPLLIALWFLRFLKKARKMALKIFYARFNTNIFVFSIYYKSLKTGIRILFSLRILASHFLASRYIRSNIMHISINLLMIKFGDKIIIKNSLLSGTPVCPRNSKFSWFLYITHRGSEFERQ